MLNILSVANKPFMLKVVMLNVIMLSVVVPNKDSSLLQKLLVKKYFVLED